MANETTELLYDLTLLQTTGKDDQEFVKKLVAIFVEVMPASMAEIVTYAKENNRDQIRKAAHKIKSSIELMGIHSARDLIKKIENISENDPNIRIYAVELENILGNVVFQLKKLI